MWPTRDIVRQSAVAMTPRSYPKLLEFCLVGGLVAALLMIFTTPRRKSHRERMADALDEIAERLGRKDD